MITYPGTNGSNGIGLQHSDTVFQLDSSLRIVAFSTPPNCKIPLNFRVGDNYLARLHPDLRSQFAAVIADVLDSGIPQRIRILPGQLFQELAVNALVSRSGVINQSSIEILVVESIEAELGMSLCFDGAPIAIFQILAEKLGEVLWIWDPTQARISYVSQSYEEIWGRSRQDLLRNSSDFLNAIHPEDLATVVRSLQQQMQGHSTDLEYRIIRPNETVCWIRDRGFAHVGTDGVVTLVYGIAEDITQRKLDAASLAVSERRYAHLINNVPVGIVRTDQFGRNTFINAALTEMMQLDATDLLEDRWQRMIVSEDVELIVEKWSESVLTRQTFSAIGRFKRGDGSIVHIQSRFEPDYDASGLFLGHIGMLTDVTQLSAAIELLEQSNRRLEFALEWGSDGFWQVDVEAKSLQVSDGWCRTLNYSRGDSPSSMAEALALIHPDDLDLTRSKLEAALSGERAHFSHEVRLRDATGSYRPTKQSGKLFLDSTRGSEARLVMIGLMTDLTDQRETENRLTSAMELIHQADLHNAKSILLGAIAHEINQPLYSIQNFSRAANEYLRRFVDNDHKDLQLTTLATQALARVEEQILLAGEIMQRLRGLAQGLPLKSEVLCVNAVMSDALRIMQPYLDNWGGRINRRFLATESKVNVGALELQLVVMNLIRNAVESVISTHSAGTVTVETRTNGELIRISICDTGNGLPSSETTDLFRPFFSAKKGGLGIGLAVTESLVMTMSGRIWYEPNLPRGAIFHVEFQRAYDPLTSDSEDDHKNGI